MDTSATKMAAVALCAKKLSRKVFLSACRTPLVRNHAATLCNSCLRPMQTHRPLNAVLLSKPLCAHKWDSRSGRYCSTRSDNADLMDCPRIVWPNLLLSLKNRIQAAFIIKPYLDISFNQGEFLDGAKQVINLIALLTSDVSHTQLIVRAQCQTV